MDIKEISSEKLGEKYYKIKHPSGLSIYVYPKEGYRSCYAIFGTKFGSVNTCFRVNGGEKITVPDGIAHYLEHKLFESEDGDAFLRYAKTGASANAYTSFDKTCYLFSCTENFKESLEILLDFVQTPYFTPETVQKEQGIIGQEIRMYDDSPDWRVMFNLLEGMYHNHPVKIDIAGTVESIADITAEKLYDCYNVFYNLGNMVLTVAGNTTVEEVLEIADKMLKDAPEKKIESFFPKEPYAVLTDYKEQFFPVEIPLFQLGFKAKADRLSTTQESAYTDILLNLLASNTSPLYQKLMDMQIINDTFSYEFFEGPEYCSVIFSGESRNPKKVSEIIKEYVSKLSSEGIGKMDFETSKRAVYGDAVSTLNNTSSISNLLADFAFTDRELFSYIDAAANAEISDIEARLKQLLDVNNTCLSVVKKEEADV